MVRRETSRRGAAARLSDSLSFRRTLLAAALALCAPASQAAAQSGYYPSRAFYNEPEMLIPPREVVFRLQDRGFTEIARPRFDGRAYVIEATNPVGIRTRLFVDARDGAMIGRQRLDTAYYPSARPPRGAPGYGWTEDDFSERRTARASEGPVPPANVPGIAPPPPRALRSEAAPSAEPPPSRLGAVDGNPDGINPDARVRRAPAPAPRRTARLSPPQKLAAPAVAPSAPAPKIEPAEPAKAEAVEPAKAETPTPAANQPPAEEKPVAEAQKRDLSWKDPPASDEAKRKVRVIGGATVVPGAGETPPAASSN